VVEWGFKQGESEMAENSKIEWTDHTVNFWWGCEKVHPGCAHCYAEAWSKRWGRRLWGPGSVRLKMDGAIDTAHKLNRKAAKEGRRFLVFSESMSDMFEDFRGEVVNKSNEVIGDSLDVLRREAFECIDATPHLIWLVLTKRPENVRRMWPDIDEESELWFFNEEDQKARGLTHAGPHKGRLIRGNSERKNVWLGTSPCNQETADRSIPELLKVRDLCGGTFLSCEPLLGGIDLRRVGKTLRGNDHDVMCGWEMSYRYKARNPSEGSMGSYSWMTDDRIDWVIAGGESGPKARPMHQDWVRGLRDQCQAAGVPFLFKQWGEHRPVGNRAPDGTLIDFVGMEKVGKAAAGRTLDGREWNEFPAAFNRVDVTASV